MEPYHRRALHKSMIELTTDLDPLEVMPELMAEEIMKPEDFEELESKCNRKLRVIHFISKLERRGPKAFSTFLLALEQKPVYEELVRTLKRHEESSRAQVETEIDEFFNAVKGSDNFEFLYVKLNLAEHIEKRDALKICEHFELREDATAQVKSSANPGSTVLELCEELRHFTPSNVSPLLQAFKVLELEDALNVLQDYQKTLTWPELTISLKVSADANLSSSFTNEATNFSSNQHINRKRGFHEERKLQTFFQNELSLWFVGFREDVIVLRVSTLTDLLKLEKQINSGELSKRLSSLLLTKDGSENLAGRDAGNLEASCDPRALHEAKYTLTGQNLPPHVQSSDEPGEDFPPYEESDDEEILTANEKTLNFDDLLQQLGLKDKFPGIMGLQEFVKVKQPGSTRAETNIVEMFWQKISSLDYRVRSDRFLRLNNLQQLSVRDFIFAVIQCSDRFLRQDIIEKMSACHLAVPVILQGVQDKKSEFLLWSLRRVVKKWKGSNSIALEQHIVQIPVFTVSFLRIGDIRDVSKSSIMNTLLGPHQGNDPHPFFLTKQEDPCKPVFSQGCLESVWYLPMNTNGSEKFRWLTNFLNLRGDCSEFPVHTKFAYTAATLTIAFIAIKNRHEKRNIIKEIKSSASRCFFIGINDERDKVPQNKKKFVEPTSEWIYYHSLDLEGIFDKISSKIVDCHEEYKGNYRTLEDLTDLCKEKIEVEECTKECNEAKQLVQGVIDFKDGEDLSQFKSRVFPLQGFWMEWVRIDKERLKPDTEREESVEFSRDDIARRKAEKRQEQLQCALSPTMGTFMKALEESEKNTGNLGYFLFYLQETLFRLADEDTRNHLEKIAFYDREIQQLDALIKPTLSGDTTEDKTREREQRHKKKRQEWKNLRLEESEKCRQKSIGWEHFLRELGQWHEAHIELDAKKDDITMSLPGIAARLLVHGYSLEIMDGDTGRVPLSWITSVLDKLTQDLMDPKILVLCVVGVQSSGKSTLLNSMFGVKFPVRAGRCTRGLFIQMLTVDATYAKTLGVEHIVLVDSEGIRSLERNSKDDCRFDNELVTLALCISDITILNIEGENIGPEMTGILEIAAHALIRMKKVDLHAQCRIIQQRVSDLTASERNKINMNQIVETLNEAVRVAAREEGYGDRYQQFSDVFDLRRDDNLQFIPCLWTGPMSPPSQFYSEVITQVKEDILSEIESQKLTPQFTVSSFTQRIRDVWDAVKDEKFLFSFQDSMKAIDFNSLCMELNNRIAEIRLNLVKEREKWQRSLQILEDNPDVAVTKLKDECRNVLQIQKRDMFSSLETFISQHKRKNSLKKYWKWLKQIMEMNFTDIENDLLSALENDVTAKRLQDAISQCVVDAKNKLRAYAKTKADIQRSTKSKNLNSKEKSDPVEIFSVKWNQLLEEGIKNFPIKSMSEKTMVATCETLLISITKDMAVSTEIQKLCQEEGGIKKHCQIEDWEKYYPEKAGEQSVKEWFIQNKHILQEIIDESVLKLRDESAGKSFDANLFQSILRHVLQTFVPPRITSDPPYYLKAKLLLHIDGKLFEVALQNQRHYEERNSFEKFFNEEKNFLREDFFSFLRNENHVDQAVKCTARYFHVFGKNAVLNLLKQDFSVIMKKNFFTNILHVNNEILKDICEKNEPHEYVQYTENYREYMMAWVQKQIVNLCGQSIDGKNVLRDRVEKMINVIRLDIISLVNFISTKEEKGRYLPNAEMNFNSWVRHFANGLHERQFPKCNEFSKEMMTYDVSDVNDFAYQLKEYLQSSWADDIFTDIAIPNEPNETGGGDFVKSFSGSVIKEHLMYVCLEQCPLCKAPCNNLLPIGPGHEHFSFTHLPRGISGIRNAGTSQLSISSCPTCVESGTSTYIASRGKRQIRRLCKNYKDDFPNWTIRPQTEKVSNHTRYWRWVLSTYNTDFAVYYQCEETKIPPSWEKISKQEALQCLIVPPASISVTLPGFPRAEPPPSRFL